MIDSRQLYQRIQTSQHSDCQKAWKQITLSEVESFAHCLENDVPLSCLSTKHPRLKSPIVLHFFLEEMVRAIDNDNIFIDYVARLRYRIHDQEIPWMPINNAQDVSHILGTSTIIKSKGGRFYHIFSEGCNKAFKYSFWVPIDFQEQTIRIIKEGHSLEENALLYKQKEQFHNHLKGSAAFPVIGYLSYLSTYIFDRVGEDAIKQYFIKMIRQCKDDLNSPISTDVYMMYIFGFRWHLKTAKSSVSEEYNRCQILFMRLILPYTIASCCFVKTRRLLYKSINLTDEEIRTLEEIYHSERYAITRMQLSDDSDIHLPYADCTWSDIKESINPIIKPFLENRILPYFNTVLSNLKKNDKFKKNVLYIEKVPKYKSALHRIYNSLFLYYQEQLYSSNLQSLQEDSDTYIIYYKRNERYKSLTINISNLPESFQMELRLVFRHMSEGQIISYSKSLINFIQYNVSRDSTLKNAFDISNYQIIAYCKKQEIEGCSSNKSRILSALRLYFDVLAKSSEDYSSLHNLINDIRLLPSIHSATEHIPEEVWIALNKHKQEFVNPQHRLVFDILNETGWRWSEVSSLNDDCLYRDNETCAPMIKTQISKTRESHLNNHLSSISRICISEKLYSQLDEYIHLNEHERKTLNTHFVFFSIIKGKAVKLHTQDYNKAVNKIIQDNHITDLEGKLFSYHSRQSRKTVAFQLINNGADVSAVQQQLGHVNSDTTKKIYAEVSKYRLAELNDHFFKQKFGYLIKPENLKLFSEQERRVLYHDFKLHLRDVDMGVCTKHPSEGPCIQNGVTTCAKCPKLCVSKNNRSEIELKLSNAEKRITEFELEYRKYGIPREEYQDYIEFKQALSDRDGFIKLLNRIDHEQ